MVLSRFGSLVMEKILKSIRFKNGNSFIDEIEYENYIHASQETDIIKTFMETNNLFRTSSAVFIILVIAKLYDWLLHDAITKMICNEFLTVISFFVLCLLFVFSFKKQTSYIKKRVDDYINQS